MQFRDLKEQYRALKNEIDAAMTKVVKIVILLVGNRLKN